MNAPHAGRRGIIFLTGFAPFAILWPLAGPSWALGAGILAVGLVVLLRRLKPRKPK
ncbi:hypothetical protein [Sinomonas sp. ASV322]|uniref:hypothetical protein n=1 Tax=Sinomonas sp. ASV322 TaxID=3041920 RepID=UPI0027DE373D|nr:hypothetical protein [Sinomonas sp. ASV322]MDQ4503332.1 hypothetical protein [Sinomonas sp. ASV322]